MGTKLDLDLTKTWHSVPAFAVPTPQSNTIMAIARERKGPYLVPSIQGCPSTMMLVGGATT